jgi:hypothetical protein
LEKIEENRPMREAVFVVGARRIISGPLSARGRA